MRPPKHKLLVDKAIEACLAAIEIYNKPAFQYREETFSILMLNAWELLLKARILRENNNRLRAIEVWEMRTLKDGASAKRARPKLTRSGNHLTLGVTRATELVRQYANNGIDDLCVENIGLLTEIRDNAVHLHNNHPSLARHIQEVGTATLRNFAKAAQAWFSIDLSQYNFFLMPLAFETPQGAMRALVDDTDKSAVGKLLRYIHSKEKAFPFDDGQRFNVAVQIELRLVRTVSKEATPIQITRDPDAPKVQMSEENIRQAFPWDYVEMCRKLRDSYSDFKMDKKFHTLRMKAENNPSLCKIRHLDPARPRGLQKKFYSPNIIREFDVAYKKKGAT